MPRSAPVEPLAAPMTDGVVTLRHRCPADVDAVVDASRDPQTRRWLDDDPLEPVTSVADRRASVRRAEETWRAGTAAPLIIADAGTDEPIGLVNLQFSDDRTATIAYSVFPAHRGRGVAPRAVQVATSWAVEDLGVEVLRLEADADNVASVRVAEKCGFHLVDEGRLLDPDGRERRTKVFQHPS